MKQKKRVLAAARDRRSVCCVRVCWPRSAPRIFVTFSHHAALTAHSLTHSSVSSCLALPCVAFSDSCVEDDEALFLLPNSKQASEFPHPYRIAPPSSAEVRAYQAWLRSVVGFSAADIAEHMALATETLGVSVGRRPSVHAIAGDDGGLENDVTDHDDDDDSSERTRVPASNEQDAAGAATATASSSSSSSNTSAAAEPSSVDEAERGVESLAPPHATSTKKSHEPIALTSKQQQASHARKSSLQYNSFPSLRFCAFLYFYRLDIPIADIVPENFGTELQWLENSQRAGQPYASFLPVPLIPIVPADEIERERTPPSPSSPIRAVSPRDDANLLRADALWWCRNPSYYNSATFLAGAAKRLPPGTVPSPDTPVALAEHPASIDTIFIAGYPSSSICHRFQTCHANITQVPYHSTLTLSLSPPPSLPPSAWPATHSDGAVLL